MKFERKPTKVIRIRQSDYRLVERMARTEDRQLASVLSKIITEWAKLQTSNTVVNNNDTQI